LAAIFSQFKCRDGKQEHRGRTAALKAVAYETGLVVTDERNNRHYHFPDHAEGKGVVSSAVMVPSNAPDLLLGKNFTTTAAHAQTLLSSISRFEEMQRKLHPGRNQTKKKDDRPIIARSDLFLLDHRLVYDESGHKREDWQQNLTYVMKDIGREKFTRRGIPAILSIHDEEGGNKNFHIHVTSFYRQLTPEGWSKNKTRPWNSNGWREYWEDGAKIARDVQLRHLKRLGVKASAWEGDRLSMPPIDRSDRQSREEGGNSNDNGRDQTNITNDSLNQQRGDNNSNRNDNEHTQKDIKTNSFNQKKQRKKKNDYSTEQLTEDYINLCRNPFSDPQAWAALQRGKKPATGRRPATKGSDYSTDKLVSAYLKLCHNPLHDLQGWNDNHTPGRKSGGLLSPPPRLDDGRKGAGAVDGLRQVRGEGGHVRSFASAAAFVTASRGRGSATAAFKATGSALSRTLAGDPTAGGRAQAAFDAVWLKWQGLIESTMQDRGLNADQRAAAIVSLRQQQAREAAAARQRILAEEKQNRKARRRMQTRPKPPPAPA